MRLVRKFSKLFTLLAVVSISVWSFGCADQADKGGKSKANGTANKSMEAGSTGGAGGGVTTPSDDEAKQTQADEK